MRIIFKFMMVLSLVFVQCQSFAAAGWSGKATVEGIYTLNESRALVKLSNFTNPNNCLTGANGDVLINPTTQKAWFTVLLSAYMGKKTVNIYVTANCTEVWASTSYANVGHVRLL